MHDNGRVTTLSRTSNGKQTAYLRNKRIKDDKAIPWFSGLIIASENIFKVTRLIKMYRKYFSEGPYMSSPLEMVFFS